MTNVCMVAAVAAVLGDACLYLTHRVCALHKAKCVSARRSSTVLSIVPCSWSADNTIGVINIMGVNLIRVREVLSIPQPMESNATRLGDLEIDLDPNPRFCVAQYGSRTLESLSDTE